MKLFEVVHFGHLLWIFIKNVYSNEINLHVLQVDYIKFNPEEKEMILIDLLEGILSQVRKTTSLS